MPPKGLESLVSLIQKLILKFIGHFTEGEYKAIFEVQQMLSEQKAQENIKNGFIKENTPFRGDQS